MEMEISDLENNYDDSFKIHFNEKFSIIKDLYKELDDFSLSSYYFFFKGLQCELGINKKKNLTFALEFYEQGGNLNNPFCFYRLYLIYKQYDYEKSLYNILKFFSYYDHHSFLNNFISQSELMELKQKIRENTETIKNLIHKNQNEYLISSKEVDFLINNLNNIQGEEGSVCSSYSTSLIEIYKSTKHEEALYHIFSYLVKANQNSYLEELLNEKTIRNSNLKLYPLLINFVKNNIGRINNNIFLNNIFHIIKENSLEFKRKLKIGGYFKLHAELIANSLYVKDLFNSENTENLKPKVNKVIKKLYKAIQSGDFSIIPDFFYLNIYFCKQLGDFDNLHNSNMLDNVFQLLNELTNLKNNSSLMFVKALFYMKGVKVNKNYKKSLQIFVEHIYNTSNTNKDDELNLIVDYYTIKCYLKLSDKKSIDIISNRFYDKILLLLKINQNASNMLSVQLSYLIGKFLLLHKNDLTNSYQILSACLNTNYNYKFNPKPNGNSNINFSLSITDKIFICKILNFLSNRKEYESVNNINLKDFCNLSPSEIAISVDINKCEFCNERDKEIMAVPCGHKFICSECILKKEKFLLDEDIYCKKCNHRIESFLKKIYY